MQVLITGAAGSIGRYLTGKFLNDGWQVRCLDKVVPEGGFPQGAEAVVCSIEDRDAVDRAMEGIDLVLHLAWSFSDDPLTLLTTDLAGHLYLLEAAHANSTKHFIYTSSAVVYGKPLQLPIAEDHPLLVHHSRKPFYAAAKAAAEGLTLAYGRERGLSCTILRFWWAFGQEIGGRHLREMIATARSGKPLAVPDPAGGSFVHMDDLAHVIKLISSSERASGQVYNLSTIYLTWREVAEDIIQATSSLSRVETVPLSDWRGSAFLRDQWWLSTQKIKEELGFSSVYDDTGARNAFREALEWCASQIS